MFTLFFSNVGLVDVFIYFYIFIVGTVFGSFFNVVVYRLPQKLSIVKGHSFCQNCHHQIQWYDLFPIFSFLFLKGKCRHCGKRISLQSPLIEAFYGISYVVFAIKFGFTIALPFYLIIVSILIAIALIDMSTSTIPDALLFAITPFILSISLIETNIDLLSRVSGALIISLPMFCLALLIENAFGGGDMKLMVACGFMLGFRQTLVAAFLAFLLGGIYALYLICKKKVNRKATMPFGQFLVCGVLLSMLFGSSIATAYMRLF